MIPAKPTVYAGRHFRSRLEASWAAWFDGIGFAWTYEPTPLVDDYQPDFLLQLDDRDRGLYVETKPERYVEWLERHAPDIERWKAHTLAADGISLLVLIGRPGRWNEGRIDEERLNDSAILFYEVDGAVESVGVRFEGCDVCSEVGLALVHGAYKCACLRLRDKRLSRRILSAAQLVRNQAWLRHGAEHPQPHNNGRP